MSWSLLNRFINSELFSNDPSLCVGYLSRYASHVGIQWLLCQKLRQFEYEQVEFFLPQLCHLLVSVEHESMALEEFIIDLCIESATGALLTFWLFQSQLHDLSSEPTSSHFKTCRRIFNKVQRIVFGTTPNIGTEKIKENNVTPITVLASLILGGVAAPLLPREMGLLAVSQARKPRPTEDTISETPQIQRPKRISRSNTVSGASSTANRVRRSNHQRSTSDSLSSAKETLGKRAKVSRPSGKRQPSALKSALRSQGSMQPPSPLLLSNGSHFSTSSLPETKRAISPLAYARQHSSAGLSSGSSPIFSRSYSSKTAFSGLPEMSRHEQIHTLRSNYFRSETQFLSALEDISNRLVIVPKQARLSALRAELALVARDLPAEVDMPTLSPATLENGSPSQSRHHRIVRINPSEATVLNSAERVPYLLMIEVLREDFDFNPDSESNKRLLATLAYQKDYGNRRLFDITPAARASVDYAGAFMPDSVFEPATGDLSSPELLRDLSDLDLARQSQAHGRNGHLEFKLYPPRPSSGTHTRSSYSIVSTPRTSDVPNSRASSPGRNSRVPSGQQTDFSALATHMRTAAQMLAQLELSGSKRPRQEVQAIKEKIIASMQSLEEQNFNNEDTTEPPPFDTILAVSAHNAEGLEDDPERIADPNSSSGAGAARMENDQKTGGVKRKGDRDDPSAATFGEEWNGKRERIRRSSPYGWMSNWDLLSVIVKTGSDLRQEMFACQLIRICSKIWEDAGVPVWVKKMKILVTGESSGIIETISNGVSLHSLKRSLTLSSIAAGTNPRKRIATLKDHFIRTFGEIESPAYRTAVDNFIRSFAAYSMLSYILQLKDRHNGNILIDNQGHIIHIDFGFMLSNSPGSVGFEAAPFKLTQDYVEVLGGVGSADFEAWKALCKVAFQALRKNADAVISAVEMMGKESRMACYASGGSAYVTSSLKQRFCLHLSKEEAEGHVEDLIAKSSGSYYTRLYDAYQYRSQGIY